MFVDVYGKYTDAYNDDEVNEPGKNDFNILQ